MRIGVGRAIPSRVFNYRNRPPGKSAGAELPMRGDGDRANALVALSHPSA
jgi:hypothetical protein